jgi:hypothetical protein
VVLTVFNLSDTKCKYQLLCNVFIFLNPYNEGHGATSTSGRYKLKKKRRYDDSYRQFGLTCVDSSAPDVQSVSCYQTLENSSMVP